MNRETFSKDHMVRHTPRPWYPSYLGGAVCSTNRPDSPHVIENTAVYGGFLICESILRREDVAIICAAPDMYRTLENILDWLSGPLDEARAGAFHEQIWKLFWDINRLTTYRLDEKK